MEQTAGEVSQTRARVGHRHKMYLFCCILEVGINYFCFSEMNETVAC